MRPGYEEGSVRIEPADPEEAERLELPPGDDVVVVDRVRTADGRRVAYTVDFLPGFLFARRHDLLRRLVRGSLYTALERELGIVVHHGVAGFAPARATRKVADKLAVPRGTLVLYLHQVDYDEGARPVLSSHEHHLADAFEFTVVRRGPGRRGRGRRSP
jgi:GntR family transcriptional regulator